MLISQDPAKVPASYCQSAYYTLPSNLNHNLKEIPSVNLKISGEFPGPPREQELRLES